MVDCQIVAYIYFINVKHSLDCWIDSRFSLSSWIMVLKIMQLHLKKEVVKCESKYKGKYQRQGHWLQLEIQMKFQEFKRGVPLCHCASTGPLLCSVLTLYNQDLPLSIEIHFSAGNLPCSIKYNQLQCTGKGPSYPNSAISKYVDDNKSLLRRMFGIQEERQKSVKKTTIKVIRTFSPDK